tara:strand:- start:418 stop:918 length:501 start_codon:yes stop_codon:yes gene_type:complete
MAYLRRSIGTVKGRVGTVTNLSGVLPAGVTGGSGLTALGTLASGNFDTLFPYATSGMTTGTGALGYQNIGLLRVGVGRDKFDTSYGTHTGTTQSTHDNSFVLSFTGFSVAPRVMAVPEANHHDSWIYGISSVSTTAATVSIGGNRSNGVGGAGTNYFHWLVIGTAS